MTVPGNTDHTAAPLTPSSRISRKANVPWKELDGVALILALDSGDYFELDETGLYLWRLLERETTPRDCAARLAAEFEVTSDEATSDVMSFVESLREHDLITVL